MSEPAYRRMPVDERHRQLLAHAAELFGRYAFAELSMARIAREAGISKALLYHYFPSKQELFVATLQQAADELREATEPLPDAPPLEALAHSVGAFLAWVEQHATAYRKLLESTGSVPEIGALIDEVRERTASRILDGLGVDAATTPRVRVAVRSWLWQMDGAILDWSEHGDLSRDELRDFLLGALAGSLMAAGAADLLTAAGGA